MNIAGMVLGIIAVLFAWIPIIGFASVPLVAVGLPLSALGFQRSRRERSGPGMAITGLVTNIVAAAINVLYVVFIVIGVAAD